MICIGAGVSQARIPNQLHHHEKKRTQRKNIANLSMIEMDSVIKPAIAARPLILTSGASGRVTALFSLRALRSLFLLFNSFLLLLLLPFRRRTIIVSEKSERSPDGAADEKSFPSSSSSSSSSSVMVRVPAAMVRRGRDTGDAAARRAMAIRRLGLKEEEGEEWRTKREFFIFSTTRGDSLFTQSWTPLSVQTRGLVVLLHGLNEHSGRYNHFAMQLNDNGFKVYGMDWIGHGGSDELHGYVHSLDYAVNDLKAFLKKVLTDNPGLPCFLFGHSTGGAIVLKAVLDPKIEARIEGVVLTSPALHVQPSHPIVEVIAPICSLLVPKYQFSSANKKGPPVSRDPEALKAKYSDPLVFTGSIRVRTGYEILRISYYLQRNLNRVTVPFLVLHGTADTVTDPEATQRLYREASSVDKSIKLYEGFLHDLLFEPEKDDIARNIIDWLQSRVDAQCRA